MLLLELRAGAFELVVSPMLLDELSEVLRRPKFRRYVTDHEIDAYVSLIRQESSIVDNPSPSSPPIDLDPDDVFLVDLARQANVDALVSGDARLLALAEWLPVMSPREFLDSLADA